MPPASPSSKGGVMVCVAVAPQLHAHHLDEPAKLEDLLDGRAALRDVAYTMPAATTLSPSRAPAPDRDACRSECVPNTATRSPPPPPARGRGGCCRRRPRCCADAGRRHAAARAAAARAAGGASSPPIPRSRHGSHRRPTKRGGDTLQLHARGGAGGGRLPTASQPRHRPVVGAAHAGMRRRMGSLIQKDACRARPRRRRRRRRRRSRGRVRFRLESTII